MLLDWTWPRIFTIGLRLAEASVRDHLSSIGGQINLYLLINDPVVDDG
jgi:hypothetical protein